MHSPCVYALVCACMLSHFSRVPLCAITWTLHGIFQVRIPGWVAMRSSKGSSGPRDRTWVSYVSCTAGRFFTKASACNVGDLGSIPGSGRSSGDRNGNLLQYSCLQNPMDGGAWWATVHGLRRVGHHWATSLSFTFFTASASWEPVLGYNLIWPNTGHVDMSSKSWIISGSQWQVFR